MTNADTLDGYTIRKELGGYTLTDPDGDYIMIGGFGHVAPNYRAAVVERDTRIESNTVTSHVSATESVAVQEIGATYDTRPDRPIRITD